MLKENKLNIVIDGQWGSTGKGKFVGYLALKYDPKLSVCNFMTNAGHTFIFEDGRKAVFQQIPVSAVNPNTLLFLNSACGITLHQLFNEMEHLKSINVDVAHRLYIDRHAFIITDEHARIEREATVHIASTMKGCGKALSDKIMRGRNVVLAKDVSELSPYIVKVSDAVTDLLNTDNNIGIGETAQGYDLSLNHGTTYPYVTSRDVTPATFIGECGISHKFIGNVIGVLRTYPIRVGNVVIGNTTLGVSGDYYSDQQEIDWDTISRIRRIDTLERTTVTNRIRRIFTFSIMQFINFYKACSPDYLALNFVNYFPSIDYNSTLPEVLNNPYVYDLIHSINKVVSKVTLRDFALFGTGANNRDIIDTYCVSDQALETIITNQSLKGYGL